MHHRLRQVSPETKLGVRINFHDLGIMNDVISIPLQIPAEIWPSFPGTSVFAQGAWEEVLFLLLRRQEQSLQS